MFAGFTPPQTPLLAVDRAALERNLTAMQGLCDRAGVRLRAHGKTHKCSRLGRMQMARGAVGLCAQTIGEANTKRAMSGPRTPPRRSTPTVGRRRGMRSGRCSPGSPWCSVSCMGS